MRGNGTSSNGDPRIAEARVVSARGGAVLMVRLKDGRFLGLPLWLYPTLLDATDAERKKLKIISGGRGLSWSALDLDLSIGGMLAGRPDFTSRARAVGDELGLKNYARMVTFWSSPRRAG